MSRPRTTDHQSFSDFKWEEQINFVSKALIKKTYFLHLLPQHNPLHNFNILENPKHKPSSDINFFVLNLSWKYCTVSLIKYSSKQLVVLKYVWNIFTAHQMLYLHSFNINKKLALHIFEERDILSFSLWSLWGIKPAPWSTWVNHFTICYGNGNTVGVSFALL